ncbi:MAG TPA: TIGR01777 family oxidoreductase, partial [Planctomycetota bacterium]|nr:TIGR01777 family oxidoreductase [Planctomycetota bacterium]
MKIVVPGGTGHIGGVLVRALRVQGHEVIVLSRRQPPEPGMVSWDGRSLGPWGDALDGADAVINLAGRSVNCRYSPRHLKEMMDSRVESTRAVGRAIRRARKPPRLWLQMSTATIYSHRYDAPNDERDGALGGNEPDAPSSWRPSIEIAKAWEAALEEASTPTTRKIALRLAMVMSAEKGGTLDLLLGLTRWGLGGAIGGGHQFMSWVHERDWIRAVAFLLQREDLEGPINLSAPNPLPQRDFMAALRKAWGTRIGLPATKWMLALGTWILRSESELVLKSRRVVPTRLVEAGFTFEFPDWSKAAQD